MLSVPAIQVYYACDSCARMHARIHTPAQFFVLLRVLPMPVYRHTSRLPTVCTHTLYTCTHVCPRLWLRILRLHPHSEVEIFTYVVEGQLTHADTLGNRETLSPGCVQYLSAGTGVQHAVREHHCSCVALEGGGHGTHARGTPVPSCLPTRRQGCVCGGGLQHMV